MAKFEVEMMQIVVEKAVIIIDADDEDQAAAIAEDEYGRGGGKAIDWSFEHQHDFQVLDVTTP